MNSGETFEGKLVRLADDFDNSAEPVTEMVVLTRTPHIIPSREPSTVTDAR